MRKHDARAQRRQSQHRERRMYYEKRKREVEEEIEAVAEDESDDTRGKQPQKGLRARHKSRRKTGFII